MHLPFGAACLLAAWLGCADDTPAPVPATDTAPEEEPCPWEDTASAKSSDDGDGFLASECDCDEGNSEVHPGARETCNGIDDDCDGVIDEGVVAIAYLDGDADGYGDADAPALTCDLPRAHVWTAGDCDDSDPAISPDATERCDNVDNDCDGVIDEGGPCR